MTGHDLVTVAVGAGVLAFLWYLPLGKPWFGFRKPPGHPGRWGE